MKKKMTKKEIHSLIEKGLKYDEEVKIPLSFNKGVWDKIGEPSPSIIYRIFDALKKPAFYVKTAAVLAAVMFFVVIGRNSLSRGPEVADIRTEIKQNENKIVTNTITEKNIIKREIEKGITEKPQMARVEKDEVFGNKEITEKVRPENNTYAHTVDTTIHAQNGVGSSQGGGMTAASLKDDKEIPVITTPVPVVKDVVVKNNIINAGQGEKVIIQYKVNETSGINITVYNKKGEPVRKLVCGEKQPGTFEAQWGGEDDRGGIVGAGIYIVHVNTGLVNKKYKVAVIR